MAQTTLTLTVYFEDPFWVGVFERVEDDQLSVCSMFSAQSQRMPKCSRSYSSVSGSWRSVQPSLQIARCITAIRNAASAPRESLRITRHRQQSATGARRSARSQQKQPQRFSAQSPRRSTGRTLRQTPCQTKSQTPWALIAQPQARRLRLFSSTTENQQHNAAGENQSCFLTTGIQISL
mgnify:CR=1 FL=1